METRENPFEKELTDMTKRDIRQFIINLDKENPDEYKAQAENLYKAGVTGAALIADYDDGKEAFITAMKDDYKIVSTGFAKTLYQKLKDKQRAATDPVNELARGVASLQISIPLIDGVNLKSPVTLPREEVVKDIIEASKCNRLLLRGPPASGKSSLLILLEAALKRDGVPCKRIQASSQGQNVPWLYKNVIDTKWTQNKGYILLDDAQFAYADEEFWTQLKILNNTYFIGCSTIRFRARSSTPPGIKPYTKIMFSKIEVEDFFSRVIGSQKSYNVPNTKALKSLLMSQAQTSGGYHIGTIKISLEYFHLKLKNHSEKSMKGITSKYFSKDALGYFERIWPYDGNPMGKIFTPDERATIKTCLIKGTKLESEAIEEKLTRRFVISDENPDEKLENRFLFPLARQFAFLHIFPSRLDRDPEYKTPFDLVVAALEKFTTLELLQNCAGRDFPKETSLQHIFDHALRKVSGKDVEICSEMSKIFNGSAASIDFYLNTRYGWGFELLVNGKGLQEHLDRTDHQCATPELLEHRTIDFMKPKTQHRKNKSPNSSSLIRVQFHDGFRGADIYRDQDPEHKTKVEFHG